MVGEEMRGGSQEGTHGNAVARGCLVWSVCTVGVLLASAAPAHAHPLIEAGQQRYEEAEFLEALQAFSEAEATDELSREELLDLYYSRALVHFALDETGAMDEDLARLVSVEPGYEPSSQPPPAVQERLAAARRRIPRRLALEVTVEPTADGVRLLHEVRNDVMRLVRSVRTHGRVRTDGWLVDEDGSLELRHGGRGASYFVEAIGPGGAVLVSEGTRASPILIEGAAVPAGPAEAVDEEGGSILWWVVGGVALAAAIGVGVVLLLFTAGAPSTQLEGPTVMRF